MCVSPIKINNPILTGSNSIPRTAPKKSEEPNNQILQKLADVVPRDQVEIKTTNSRVSQEISSPSNEGVSRAFTQGLKEKQKPQEISPKGATEYNEAETQAIIRAAEKHGRDLFPEDPIAAADTAWSWSLQKRNEDPKDVNWAAAEHYLYAKSRGKESKVEAVTMGILAAGYDVVKAGLFAIDREEWLSTNNRKDDISRPTLGSTISGIRGAIDSFKED